MDAEADTLIISYGITARAAKAVFKDQKRKGKPIALLVLKTLWPVPEKLIRETAQNFKRVIVVEMNLGQYVREVERILPGKKIDFLGQMDGRLITPQQIEEAIVHV
jgi:2-oxoglutarate ferredoxin oxidoreductase subunit alpha